MHEESPEPQRAPLPAAPGQQCPGELCPQIWDRSPASTGTAARPPPLAPLRASRGKVWTQGKPGLTPSPRRSNWVHSPEVVPMAVPFVCGRLSQVSCREGITEALKPHAVILYLQEFGSQASRLSPGSPGHTCPPSSAPSLPCKAKNRI